jgi:aldehyde:ferredoxin oxidoreductase
MRHPVPSVRFSFSGKARINVAAEDTYAVADSLAVCRFAFLGATLEDYSEMYKAITVLDSDVAELMKIGASIHMTERFYNVTNGFGREEDELPERFIASREQVQKG